MWKQIALSQRIICPHLLIPKLSDYSLTHYIVLSIISHVSFKNHLFRDFPGGAVVKNPPVNAGDTGSSPGPGRSHTLRSN